MGQINRLKRHIGDLQNALTKKRKAIKLNENELIKLRVQVDDLRAKLAEAKNQLEEAKGNAGQEANT